MNTATPSFTVTIRATHALIAIGVLVCGWLLLGQTSAQTPTAPFGSELGLPRNTLRGNLTIEFSLDPAAGPAANDFMGPYRRVDEVTLYDEWAVLRKADSTGRGSLIVPRSRLVYINVGE